MKKDQRVNMTLIPQRWYLNRVLVTTWLCLASFHLSFGQSELKDVFEKANSAYQQGQYPNAIRTYNLLLEQGISNASLYYNLGCAYLKNDQLALAILNFERAIELKPFNQDYQTNLDLANKMKTDDFSNIQGFFFTRWLEYLIKIGSSSFWAILSILLLFFAISSLIFWLFSQVYLLKRIAFVSGIILLGITFCAFIFGHWKQKLEYQNPFAIHINNQTEIRIAPDEESRGLIPIHEGLKVRIIDEIGEWYKIELSNKEVGWVPQNSLIRI